MQSGVNNNQDPLSQSSGTVDAGSLYKPAPLDKRKEKILEHYIFIDKVLLVVLSALTLIGILLAKFEPSTIVKTIGSGMTGAAIGALANRMKDGKISPD